MSSEEGPTSFTLYVVTSQKDLEEYSEESMASINLESASLGSLTLNARCVSASSQPQAEANVADEKSSLNSPVQPAICLMKPKNRCMKTVNRNIVEPKPRPRAQPINKVLLEKKIIEYFGQKHDCTASKKEFATLYLSLLPQDYLESRARSSFNMRVRVALNNLCKDGVLRKIKGNSTRKGCLYQYTNRHQDLEIMQARAEALSAEREALLAKIAQLEKSEFDLKQNLTATTQNLAAMTEDRNAWREMATRQW